MEDYALITGAAGGLGKAFAVECARRGYNLYLTDRFGDKLDALAQALSRTYSVQTAAYACDLMHMDARRALFSDIIRRGITPGLCVCVAGLDFEGAVSDQSREAICSIVRINAEATLDVNHFFANLPHSGRYYIINVASLGGFCPMPLKAAYAAAKRLVINFSLALREEIRHSGGALTVLCPAGMRTNREIIENIDSQRLIGRLTTLETGAIAAGALKSVFKNRAFCIPGTFNRFLRLLTVVFPSRLVARAIHYRWRVTRKRLPLAKER